MTHKTVPEAIETLRAVRHFEDRAVEEEDLEEVLELATKAPSSGNSQPWEFVVVTDEDLKRQVAEPMARTWRETVGRYVSEMSGKKRRVYEEASQMVENTPNVPALVFACIDLESASSTEEAKWSSIYPAVQNLLLAAWDKGIGTCLTIHGSTEKRGEADVKEILGVPDRVKIAACIYVGYPATELSPPKRKPVEDVTHWEGW